MANVLWRPSHRAFVVSWSFFSESRPRKDRDNQLIRPDSLKQNPVFSLSNQIPQLLNIFLLIQIQREVPILFLTVLIARLTYSPS